MSLLYKLTFRCLNGVIGSTLLIDKGAVANHQSVGQLIHQILGYKMF